MAVLAAWFMAIRLLPCAVHRGAAPTAVEAAAQVQGNLETLVLATVNASGWRQSWARNFIAFLMGLHGTCSQIYLLCVKGGPASEQEMGMVQFLLPLMGFAAGPADEHSCVFLPGFAFLPFHRAWYPPLLLYCHCSGRVGG